jgi:glutamine amidotransferase
MSAAPRRARATFWLLDAPDSISAQSHGNPDGTGVGSYDEHDCPHVSKQPLPAYDDATFARRAHELVSRTFVAHIRFASTGALERRNTHPFEQRERLFAHNGVLGGLPVLERELGEARALVHGDTDSERLFALVTRQIDAHAGDVPAGIAAACSWVAANLPLFSINFVLVSAAELWALRYPDTHELYVLERAAGTPLEHASSFGTRVVSEHAARNPVVVVASERLDADPGWRLLHPGELVHVGPTLEVSSSLILDAPPAHRLTLVDLDERARASQHPGTPPSA